MAIVLDGKNLAGQILQNLEKAVKKSNKKLRLAVILVGEDPASLVFISRKQKAAEKIGISFKLYEFSESVTHENLKKQAKEIIADPKNSGVIIQLPLPKHIREQEILNLIMPEKDIDLLSEDAFDRFRLGEFPVLPPVAGAIAALLKEYRIPVRGKNAVVVGAGKLVGLPATIWLEQQGAIVTTLNSSTKNTSSFTKRADILVSGVGRPNLIKASSVKRGVVVIDAGTSSAKGKLKGDVDFAAVSQKAGHITPVPGGVGPLTVATLLENLVKLNE